MTKTFLTHCALAAALLVAAGNAAAQPQPVPPKAARELDQASYVELFKQWRAYMDTHGETAVGLVNLGMAYEYSGEREAALQAARRAVNLEAESPQALAYLGKLLSIIEDDQEAALASLLECRRLAPDYGFGLTMLATVQLKLGQLAQAQATFKTVFDRNVISRPLQDYGYNLLVGLPQGAVLVTAGDSDTYAVLSLQAGLGFRQDVAVLNISLLNVPAYATAVFGRYPAIRPDYDIAKHVLALTSDGPTSLDAALLKTIIRERKAPVYYSVAVDRDRYGYVDKVVNEGLVVRAAPKGLGAGEVAELMLEKYRLDSATDWTQPKALAPNEVRFMGNYAVAMLMTAQKEGVAGRLRERLFERAAAIADFHELTAMASRIAELRRR